MRRKVVLPALGQNLAQRLGLIGFAQMRRQGFGGFQRIIGQVELIYFDAGGGHRSAALALKEVIGERYPGWTIQLVNLQEILGPVDMFQKVTGLQSQDFYNAILKRGWTFGGEHAGHLIGRFPFSRAERDHARNRIRPDNEWPMHAPGPNGEPRHWVLEVHLLDPTGTFGGFYEELLERSLTAGSS